MYSIIYQGVESLPRCLIVFRLLSYRHRSISLRLRSLPALGMSSLLPNCCSAGRIHSGKSLERDIQIHSYILIDPEWTYSADVVADIPFDQIFIDHLCLCTEKLSVFSIVDFASPAATINMAESSTIKANVLAILACSIPSALAASSTVALDSSSSLTCSSLFHFLGVLLPFLDS